MTLAAAGREHSGGHLCNGDQVVGTLNGETGTIVQLEGDLIRVRIDSNGQVWSSVRSIWVKR
jgi:hypothetical protein